MGRATEGHDGFLAGLKEKVRAAGLSDRVRFLPEVPVHEIADWYRVLDLYVAPQRWEGFGLTPIEAMACGVPVVATRVGAFEEIVTEATGTLVPPDDIPALTAAIAPWLDEPGRRRAASVGGAREGPVRVPDRGRGGRAGRRLPPASLRGKLVTRAGFTLARILRRDAALATFSAPQRSADGGAEGQARCARRQCPFAGRARRRGRDRRCRRRHPHQPRADARAALAR